MISRVVYIIAFLILMGQVAEAQKRSFDLVPAGQNQPVSEAIVDPAYYNDSMIFQNDKSNEIPKVETEKKVIIEPNEMVAEKDSMVPKLFHLLLISRIKNPVHILYKLLLY